MQLNIEFNPTHKRENNSESQATLDLRRDDFNEQCWNVLKRMLAGEKITNKSGLESGIGDIRRRAKDLIDVFKIPVQREWAISASGEKEKFKWYFIKPEDTPVVMKRIIDLLTVTN